jgi:hypothetical protein
VTAGGEACGWLAGARVGGRVVADPLGMMDGLELGIVVAVRLADGEAVSPSFNTSKATVAPLGTADRGAGLCSITCQLLSMI